MDETGRDLSHLFPVPVSAQSRPPIDMAPFSLLEESLSAVIPTEELISEFFSIMRVRSPPQSESDLQILPTLQAPPPHLEDSTSTPSRDEPNSRETLNSGAQFKVSTKCFDTDNAMSGHMIVHHDMGSKSFKNPSVAKPKPGPVPNLCNKLTASCIVTENQSPRELSDKKVPEQVTASSFIDISNSTRNCQSKKSMTAEFSRLEEEVADILIDMPNIIRDCHCQKRRMPESIRLENKKLRIDESALLEDKKYVCLICNKTFPSYQALGGHCSSHKMPRANVVSVESAELQSGDMKENMKRKAKSGPHVCKICGESFLTGPKLGGHKRAHYKKVDLHDK